MNGHLLWRNIQKYFSSFACFYVLLVAIIVLPYALHPREYLVGGDLGFFEEQINTNLGRLYYLWSDHLGLGGLSVGKSGNLVFYIVVGYVSKILPPVETQLLLKLVFYSIGYVGLYLCLLYSSKYLETKENLLAASSVAFFFCTNLITFDFTRSWFHLFYIFYLVTPALIYTGLKYARNGNSLYLFLFILLAVLDMPIFTNLSFPPIQILVLYSILFVFEYINWRRILILFSLFIFLNFSSLVEYAILISQLAASYISSDFNKVLVEDYALTQVRYFSTANLLQFLSGRLFSLNWSSHGQLFQFFFTDLYSTLFYRLNNAIPLLILFIGAIRGISKKRALTIYLLLLFIVSLPLTSMQGFAPLNGFFSFLFSNFPQVGIFRNSLKFSLLLVITACLLIYGTLSENRLYRRIFIVSLILLNTYSIFGQFSNYYAFGTQPEIYRNLETTLSKLNIADLDRCMIYPSSDKIWYGFTFKYFGFSPFPSSQSRLSCITKISELSSEANSTVFKKLRDTKLANPDDFRRFNIKYVILHNDINFEIFRQPNSYYSDKDFLDKNFEKIVSNDNFNIYRTFSNNVPLIDVCSRDYNIQEIDSQVYRNELLLDYVLSAARLSGENKICFSKSDSDSSKGNIYPLFADLEYKDVYNNFNKTYNFGDREVHIYHFANLGFATNTVSATLSPRASTSTQFVVSRVPFSGTVSFFYRNNASSTNRISNPSFENGPWQKLVGDCHNSDEYPKLNMKLDKISKSNGNQSLQLEAEKHVACVNQKIFVTGGKKYLFSFDYQSPNGYAAGYHLGFNDDLKTVMSERIEIDDSGWNTFRKIIEVPYTASSTYLHIYSYSVDDDTNVVTRYDNFHLIELPEDIFDYWLVNEPTENFESPRQVDYELINPTKKLVHINGATTPFYLTMSESYHNQWQLEMNNDKYQGKLDSWVPWAKPEKISSLDHFKLNGFLNGWYVDTEKLCLLDGALNEGCKRNADGSYDMELVIEFWPQRWFYLGLTISGATLLSCLVYLTYAYYVERKRREYVTAAQTRQIAPKNIIE